MENINPVETKILGLPRPLTGALVGSLLFLLIFLPLKYLDYNSLVLYMFALDLELLGRLTIVILGMAVKFDAPESVVHILSITISTLPAWIAGWQIGSHQRSTRIKGIIFSVSYLCFVLVVGTLLTLVGI